MSSAQLVAATVGLCVGLAFILVYEWANRGFVRFWNPQGGSAARLLAIVLLAPLAACFAAGVLILVPGYFIGAVSLRENTSYFGWSFLVGGILTRAFIDWRKRQKARV